MAFERWQQQLHDLLTAVHIKQRQYDNAVSACQVLLKPWPKKTQEKEQDPTKESLGCNENAASTQVDPHEEAELQLVNNLLKKAQKTRVKTASKKQEDSYPAKDDLVFVKSEKDEWDKNNSHTSTPDSRHKDEVQSSNNKPTSVIKTTDNLKQNSGSVPTGKHGNKTHQRTQPFKESEAQSSQRGSHPTERRHPSSFIVNKRASIPDVKHLKNLESSRPISRPRSSRGSVKPVHTTAPFKTDPNLHVPKRSVKNSVHPVKRQTIDKHQNHVKPRNNVNKVLPPIITQTDTSTSLTSTVQEDDNFLDDCETHSPVSSRDFQHEADTKVNVNCEDSLSKKVSGLILNSGPGLDAIGKPCEQEVLASDPEDQRPKSEEKQETKLFSLLTDGSSVNIPARVRRAFAKNHQLRKKVVQQQRGRKPRPEETNNGQKFADKLQQLFDPEEELIYRQQALECLRTHQQLLQLLMDLNLDGLTEASCAKDILRSKMLAEFVLSSFSAYSDDVALLSKVQFPATVSVAEPSHKPTAPMHLWLPLTLQGENLRSSSKLQYTSKTELAQYVNVLLHLQTLKYQHHLLDLLVKDTLPWLQGLNFHQEDFSTIFRGLFALLTSDGSQLPVLIYSSLE